MTIRKRFMSIGIGLFTLILGLALGRTTQAAAPDLFFSEYVEGSSFNKAMEIYNGTGAAVDLSAYTLQLYSNGASSPSASVTLSGTLADGDVFVMAHPSADPAILAVADATNGGVINFNGDDAVVLRKNGAVVDAFGQIGVQPISEWAGGGRDDTLRRKETVCQGDTNADDAFDASVEWDKYAQNTFDGLGAHTANCNGVTTADPKINEFSASTTGNPDVEYVEVFGNASTDYSAFTILEIEGDSTKGTIDRAFAVGTTDASGFWTTSVGNLSIENGTLTLLLVEGFTGSVGNDIDANDDGAIDFMPWARIVDDVAVSDGDAGDLTYSAVVLGPNYDGVSNFAPGGASRIPDGADTNSSADWVRNDFDLAGIPGFAGSIGLGEAYNTPGAPNAVYVLPPEACGDGFTPIYAVQGSGPASPVVNTEVAIEGVVVGDFQNNASPDNGDLNGFHVQDPVGDGNAATSDGVFVYAPGGMDVSVGDAVRVRGSVSEYNGMTEVTASQIWVCSTGNSVAATPLSLPVASVDDFEKYEGMLVTFPQALVISEYFNFDRYGEIVLTSERHLTPSAEFEPGPAAIQAAQAFLLDRITLDDGRTNQNPDPAIHPNGSIFDLSNLFRGGDTVTNVTGALDYSFGLYRVQPTQGANYTNVNPRTTAPDAVGNGLKVSSFNVLNYFTTLDNSGPVCGPQQNQDCRGADNAGEFTRQRDKIIAALTAIDADVVGLIEIENYPGDVPTADLVTGLNNLLGANIYDYIATGAIGTDAIRVALIYKPASVTPVGAYAILDSSVDARFVDDKNRPVLAQTFQDNATGGVFTLAVNHLKSKGSDCNDLGDPDTGDGAGNCNQTRKAAAEALVDWLATDPTNSGDADFLIMGDLNSYDKEDPIDAIRNGADDQLGTGDDYTDLVFQFLGENAYSYVFDGQIGYLDHALANVDLLDEVAGVTIWHINADEPDLIDYDTSFKQPAQDAIYAPDAYRASDHDPVIVGLSVCDEIAPTIDVSVSPDLLWPPNHKYVGVTATVNAADNFDQNPIVTFISATSNEPDDGTGNGDKPNDIVVIDDTHFDLRAERAGTGNGRIYTITYQVTDACGNSTQASAQVTVPHDQANAAEAGDLSSQELPNVKQSFFLPLINK